MRGEIRPATAADAAAIARVHVASWQTTYKGILPDAVLDGLSVERRAAFWGEALGQAERPGVILVADDAAAGVVGFVSAGTPQAPLAGYDAELHALYLLEEHQRGGVGRALVRAAAAALWRQGYRALFLWVLAENESRRFYAALGGREVAYGEERFGEVARAKLAYGWPDLRQLGGEDGDSSG